MVLFMSTVSNGLTFIERERRRPAATSSGAQQTRKVFGNAARKWLPIPEFINIYNHFMNSINTADQMRSYYTLLRIYRRTWKPLFHFLLNTIVTNCYKLSSYSTNGWPKRSGYKKFLERLVNSLFELSIHLP